MVMTNPVGRPKGQPAIFCYNKRCTACGVAFKSSRHDALTCSATCRKRRQRRAHSQTKEVRNG